MQPTASAFVKHFSTTTVRQVTKIPPESPDYINVPKAPLSQSDEVDNKPSPLEYKGHLPIPRPVFRQRNSAVRKADPLFLQKSAPLPTSKKSQREPLSEHEAWERRMAASRRKNLEEGITQLWERKIETENVRDVRNRRKVRRNTEAMNMPKREDEVFTEATIPAVLLETAVSRDPLAFVTARKSRQRTRKLVEKKSDDRQDALQHLYMNARSFIVDEEELNAQIEKLFKDDYFSSVGSSTGYKAQNVWDVPGMPMSVREMLSDVTKTDNKAVDSGIKDDGNRTKKRQKKITEDLTGGPMDMWRIF
ncbi:uncharacterized protein BCR38DRAFT_455097 [Pseudomassariella vexata]|uniref:Uncharacterized protein n=1 Tax=Pseudomassariella vexata TaxID=1141098 RepID=A0A1Y2EFF1_9PEZI|nr:uncharacterized protein BCR38DRAFT_455097 [Pseudomassariella vexata]ORY70279.1 hypothetical protein BCR38DRAFT_455097 [Pseudomassariella vexata]